MVYKWHGVDAKFNENLSGDSEVTESARSHNSVFHYKIGDGAVD